MPMRPITVKANFQLDTSAARAQLQGLQKELFSITKGATMDLGITPQITQAIKEAQQLKSILAEATDFSTGAFDLSKFDAAMKQYGKGINELKQNLQTLGPDGEKAFNSLATTIASAQVPLKRTSQGVKDFVTAFGNTMRWQATSMAMHKMVGTIQQAFNYAQNLDKSLTDIQIVTGHNANYMRNFAIEANKAAQALSASTLEYTNASLIYYQQGLGDKEVAKRAETTLKLAKVTGESASKVSQQMTAVWNNFSNGVDNLERYADVMTALGATTASSSSEIAKGLEKFASVTKTIGLSYDYAASALATVTAQTRQSADSVGTAFKTLFSRLESLNLGETLDDSTTLNKYSEALLKAGVNIMDVNGHLKDMDTILDELGAQWNNLNKAQQVALSQTVGGVRNYTSLITLMDNWKDFQNNVVTSQLAEGTLQRQADIYAQSWEAAQQRVKTASQGIYDTLISSDFFKGFNNALAGTLNLINGIGKGLGTSGSVAGIANLFLGLSGERVAKGIDNFTINTLGQTSFGQNVFRAQQKKILEDLTSNIYDTGVRSSQIRKDIYENLMGSWDEFRNKTYGSKAELQTNQLMMQQLTAQAQNVMNSAIDMDRLKLDSQITSRKAAEIFAGKFGMGQTSNVYNDLMRIFDNQSSDQGAYKAGFSEYLQDTFVTKLTKLASMDIDNSSSQAAQSLKGQIEAQAENAFKNTKIGNIINAEGKGSSLYTAIDMIRGGISSQNISEIITNLSMYNTEQIQAYEQMRSQLDQDFLKKNLDAAKKETITIKAGGHSRQQTRYMRDENGNLIIDETSAKGKEYLAKMSDQKEAATAALKAGYITEQQAQDILSGNKNLKDILKPQQEMTTSFGNAAVSAGQMVSSMTMAISSINNFRESIQNGTVTATNTMSMFGSLGLAMGQMVPVLTNTTKILGTGLSVAGLGGIAAGATLLAGLGVYGYNVAKAHSLNSQISYANESKISSVAQAKEDQQKYEQFLPVMQQQQQAIDKLTSLQQGTTEYTAQLIASNNQAREIIETYNLKAGKDYTVDTSGAIKFTADQIKQTNEDLLDQMQESDMLSQAAISGYTQLTNFQQQQSKEKEIFNELQNTFQAQNWSDYYTQDQVFEAYKEYSLNHGTTADQIQNFRDLQGRNYAEAWFQELTWGDNSSNSIEYWLTKLSQEGYLAKPEEINEKLGQLELDKKESELISQGDFQSLINSVLNTTEKTDVLQLGAKALGLNSDKLDEYVQYLTEQVYNASGMLGWDGESATRGSTGELKGAQQLREIYKKEFGYTARAEIAEDQQALAAAIENKRISDWINTQLTDISKQFEGSNILSDFLNINSKSYSEMEKIFSHITSGELTEDEQKIYSTFVQKALTDSVKAQDNLVQAMMANSQFNGQEYVKIAQQLQEGAANFSTQQLETLTNYINSFTNNFGEEAGKAVFDALTNNQQGWNQNYYEALQKISLDNSISALADLTQFNNQRINADLVEPLGKLRSAIIEDVESRGGLAKTLFTSSEFTKVFDSLSEQYKATGEITSQNIADLAKKNDIIGDYMTVSGANEQAIADLFEIVASGDLSVENITPAIEHFVQRASGAEGAQQEALDVVAEQDLSDSITNMDKWAQNIGKAWYTGRTHDVLGDRPVLEGLKMVLTPEDYAKYMRTLAVGAYGGTTSSMLNSMKGNMANAYAMLTELEGSGKKKGKGGGGMDTVYEYLAKSGIFDESGIQYDTNTGNFILGADFGPRYGNNHNITFSELKDYIIESLVGSDRDQYDRLTGYGFVGKGYSREQAEDLAAMMLGSMSASSMGTVLSASGLVDAANTFFGELKGEGQEQGNYITPEQYNALFNQYSDVLATMKMEQIKDEETGKTEWKLREATVEEMQAKDFKGVTATEWRQYFVQEAKKAGSAIIGIKGSIQLGKQDARVIGEAIAKESQGTIKATQGKETDAIVQAAVAAGVQMYRDYSGFGPDIRGDHFAGQSLDYDQLQNFYNNVLGLSTEILNTHLKAISEDNGGLAFTHKWTDAYGVEHNVNSRDYGGNTDAFVRSIEQENNFSNAILEFQRDQWIANYFDDDEIWKKYGDTANASGAMRYLDDMFRQAQQEAQAAANNTTQSNPTEGENGTKPEGEGETPTEGEGETNANATSTTEIVTTPEGAYEVAEAEAQAKVGKYNDYTYRGSTEAEKVYRYNLLHPTLTPAEAYDKVHSGKVDVDAEWRKKYPTEGDSSRTAYLTEEQETQAEIAKRQAMLAAKSGSAYWTSQPSEDGTRRTVTPVDRTLRRRAKDGSAYWTSQPLEGDIEGTVTTIDRTLRRRTKDGSAYWTSQPLESDTEGTVTPITIEERRAWHMQGIAARLAENRTIAGRENSAYWTANAPEAYGPENPELEIWKRRQQLEKEAKEAAAREAERAAAREAERAAIEQQQREIEEQAERAALTASMPPSEYVKYRAWVEAGGSGSAIDWQYEKRAAEGPRAPGAEEKEETKEPSNKEMREFLRENGYTNATINTAMREEGVSLKDLYQRINSALTETNKQLKGINDNTEATANNTGDVLEYQEEKTEQKQIDQNTGKTDAKGKDTNKDKDIFGNEGNTTIINEGGGDTGSGDDSGWYGGPGGSKNNKVYFGPDRFNIGVGLGKTGGKDGGSSRAPSPSKPSGGGKSGDNSKIDIKISLASGQNNARLLSYASGKEGHIAVTGELGPELRVKSDGSMDILGKKGREYAWVEPDDRIYTASQSAGILKSNKIPGLEGLAKGINNYLPGYLTGGQVASNPISTDRGGSSSGGGLSGGGGRSRGGGGTSAETDPRYDPNTLKIRDILERYYTILQKIDDITRAVEKFSKVADRAWGQDRIKAIEKQTALYQQQYDAQKKYVQEIGEYMNTDSAALTTMIREFVEGYNEGKEDEDKLTWAGAQFDSNGVLTNYRDFVEKLVEQYNANAEANAQSKEAQYKFQEQLKDIQMYTDTLNLWESETDKLQELANQILDNSLKEITYRVEYELELNADQKRLLDFRDSFVKDDIFRVAEHIANMNEEIANTAEALEKTRQGLYDYLGTLAGENMRVGEFYDDVALGLATRDEKGMVDAKSYEDIDFTEVSNNLDKWLAELREKNEESAKEVDKIIKRNEEGLIINYRDTLNKINEMNKKLSGDSISLLLTNVQSFFDQISDLANNPQWTGLSTEQKDDITNYMDAIIQNIQSMGDSFKEIVELMGDSIKSFGKKMDAEIDEFDYYGDVYKSFGNIIDLTNQHMTDITSNFFKTLNNKALDNNINKIETTRRRYELFVGTLQKVQNEYDKMIALRNQANGPEERAFYQSRVDELKEELDIANSTMESAHKEFLQSWEDALSKIQENYKSAVEQASKDFEKSFSPLFNTFELLQAQFDREKALGDLYVDNYQRIHDLNKLNRDIQLSIDDTDNLKGKERLRDLQAEINQLQEDGTELSEYDLDILDKKYKLELARQALEDAKDAKSMVRLARDNNGNWSYVYTANQDEVDKAEQDYEDAIREMEQANEDYIKNVQDQILQVRQQAQQALQSLNPDDFANPEDYWQAMKNIVDAAVKNMQFLADQGNNVYGNNLWLENYVPGIVQAHNLTDDTNDTLLSALLMINDLGDITTNTENDLNHFTNTMMERYTEYSEKQKEVYKTAGKDIATIGQSFGEEMDKLTEKSEDQIKVVMDLADRVENSFGSAMEEVTDATAKWLDQIKDIVSNYDTILAQVTALKKIDGEYVEPAKMINGDNAIDSWAEIDRFKRELRDNGILNVITTNAETGKEQATMYIAGTTMVKDFLEEAKTAAAKTEIIDIGDDVDESEDKKVRDYIHQHDLVWVKYKDEELKFNNEDEWDAWYKEHKHVVISDSGGGSNYDPDGPNGVFEWLNAHMPWLGYDTGGYTGYWQSANTGMYTGEWPSGSVRRNGRLAFLHQKELVLNAHDTENFLDAMQIVRKLDNLTNWMANGLGDIISPSVAMPQESLEQNVHIEAEFPNVSDHNEIEQAFNNLVNMASQYANRK